jgi:pimeloyl-ACP methyl ester carboxylesterase
MWNPLVRLFGERVQVTAYDRRGTARWPVPLDAPNPSTEDHAQDAADVIAELDGHSVHVCGASYGAVIALVLSMRRPELVRSLILYEPALSPRSGGNCVPPLLLAEVRRLLEEGKREQVSEVFHRRVLAEAGADWDALPAASKARARGLGRHIECDLTAHAGYFVDYGAFTTISAPVLLAHGDSSHPIFEQVVLALGNVLPRSTRILLHSATHQLSGSAWRQFAIEVANFIGVPHTD